MKVYLYRFLALTLIAAAGDALPDNLPAPSYSTSTTMHWDISTPSNAYANAAPPADYSYDLVTSTGACSYTGTAGAQSPSVNASGIVMPGSYSSGSVAISQGQGGGAGSYNGDPECADVNGGTGGAGATGGAVTAGLLYTSTITQVTFSATGIMAQSIGGPGGAGGTTDVGGSGGNGGLGGTGGYVQVSNSVSIITNTSSGYGIWAQSAGGYGGSGGGTSVYYVPDGDSGGSGAAGASGGEVSVSNSSYIKTPSSIPIFAQSIGGNGGSGGSGSCSLPCQ